MTVLRARAPGKVNLSLLLGPRRADGLHDLVSVVVSVSLADELELRPAGPAARGDEVRCPGVEGENLAARALAAYRRATGWAGPAQRLDVAKRVPVAAGMGGGSGDAAAALRLMARRTGGGGADADRLGAVAAGLGADVPGQLRPGTALVADGGRRVVRVTAPPTCALLLLPARERLSTAAVYAEADRLRLGRAPEALAELARSLDDALARGDELGDEWVVNDLEPAARSLCPAIDRALAAVAAAGADRVLVSGSGPTVVGLFRGVGGRARAEAAAGCLAARHSGARVVVPVGAAFGAVREA